MTEIDPSSYDVEAFVHDLRRRRQELLDLVGAGDSTLVGELQAAIDEIGERLLVADEELRVQNEEIIASSQRLDRLVAAHEALFASAPVPYLQTDAEGIIIRANIAARRVLELPAQWQRSLTIAGLVAAGDRPAVRNMMSAVRTDKAAEALQPAEVTVVLPNGRSRSVVLVVRGSSDIGSRKLLHWELHDSVSTSRVDGGGEPDLVPLVVLDAATFATIAADLAAQPDLDSLIEAITRTALAVTPGCLGAGILLPDAHGHLIPIGATDPRTVALDRLQASIHTGPIHAAQASGRFVVSDLDTRQQRWPVVTARIKQIAADVHTVIALSLSLNGRKLGVLTLYLSVAAGEATESGAHVLGTHASVALANTQMQRSLRDGMTTREVIGRAVGIIMAKQGLTAAKAFDQLVWASQSTQIKLREVAAWVEETGEDPADFAARHSGKQPS